MKIAKYFLLLLFLGIISLAVFILTQSGNFNVHKKITIDAPQQIVFEYLQDLDNWSDWTTSSLAQNGIYNIELDNIGIFKIKKEYSHPYDSLSQDILHDQIISNIFWKLKPNKSKTDIEFRFQGTLDLKTKIITFFKGTPNQIVSKEIEKNLNALAVFFMKQYKEFDIETQGVRTLGDTPYIYFQKNSSIQNLSKDILLEINNLKSFCLQNKLAINGNPIIVLKDQKITNSINCLFALPITEAIFLNEDEIYKTGNIDATNRLYFETILKGNYTHLGIAMTESQRAIEKKGNINLISGYPIILQLDTSIMQSKYPAEWKTKIYIPVQEESITETEEQI